MNHQLFENWLASEEPLLPDQVSSLQEHLQSCTSCRQLETALSGLDELFQRATQVTPVLGFAGRWLERMEAERRIRHRRQTWWFLSNTAGVAAILLVFLLFQLVDVFQSPVQLLFVWFYRLASFISLLGSAREILALIMKTVPGMVSLPGWILSVGLLSLISVLWIVTYQQITSPRRMRAWISQES